MEAAIAAALLKLIEFEMAKAQATAEGRRLSPEELNGFRASLMESEQELQREIANAKAEGR